MSVSGTEKFAPIVVIKVWNRTTNLTSILNFYQLGSSWIAKQDILFNNFSSFSTFNFTFIKYV